jgi:TonB-linked SusC/RagA family outer membrane protein
MKKLLKHFKETGPNNLSQKQKVKKTTTLLLFLCFFLISASSFAGEAQLSANRNGISATEALDAELLNQKSKISGKVTDSNGAPLLGVSIGIKGTSMGTISDIDGNYTLDVPDGNAIVFFSFVGYATKEIAVKGQSKIDISLIEDIIGVDEAVVVGYGTIKKSDITGAISSVKSAELTAYTTLDAVQALQGRAAGVQITSNNGGDPGGSFNVKIRGGNSINATSNPIYVVDGFVTEVLPPAEDIQSMEVLKDASATAIYGSRGANGVVMISTKTGASGKSVISFTASYSPQEVIKKLDLLDGEKFAEYITLTKPKYVKGTENTDWQDEILRQGLVKDYQLSFSGGSDKLNYYISGSIFNQDGVILGSDYKRYTVSSNINAQATKRLKVGMKLSANITDKNGAITQEISGGANTTGVISAAYKFDSDKGIYSENGSYTRAGVTDPHDNPFAIATERINQTVGNVLQGSVFAELQIFDGLKFKTTLGGNINNSRVGTYASSKLKQAESVGGIASIESTKSTDFQNENYFSYDKQIGNDHTINIIAGMSYSKYIYETWSSGGQTFINDASSYWNLGGASVFNQPNSSIIESELLSQYLRANYALMNKYFLTATVRRDGSSKFGKNNKYAIFPSGSIGWNMKKESFLQDADFLSLLKLRISYGVTGSQAIDPYQTLARVSTSLLAVVNGATVNAIAPLSVANENLKWEETSQLDFGADIGLFKSRINLTFDYYNKQTKNLLFPLPLPSYSGYSSQIANVGRIENKGFEFTINTRNLVGKFKWDTDFNISANKNKIIELPKHEDIYYSSAPGHIVTLAAGVTQILSEGEPVGAFFGFEEDGLIQSKEDILPGNSDIIGGIKIKDINGLDATRNLTGLPDGKITNDDRKILGSPQPDFIWSLNNTFSYQGFDLNIYIQASQGNEILNYTLMELNTMNGKNNATTDYLRAWTATNTDTDIPVVNAKRPYQVTSRWVEDGSYIRVKNISLGYNFSPSLLQKAKIQTLRLYVSAQNMFTFTKYKGIDPEVNYRTDNKSNGNLNQGIDYGSYPNVKSVTFGLKLTL